MWRSKCLFVLAMVMLSAPVAAREFRSSDISGRNAPTVQGLAMMGELLRERSGGRLTISTAGSSDEDSENFTLAQLRNGTLDMARINIAAFNSSVPASVLPTLPYLFRSTAHMRRVLDGPIGAELLAALDQGDVVALCFYDEGPRSIYTVGKPVRTPADLLGVKIRVQQNSIWSSMLRALGAEPVEMPMSRVRAALLANFIDASDGNWSSYLSWQHFRVARYYSLTEHAQPPGVLLFSRRVWETLSKADQALIQGAASDSVAPYRRLQDTAEREARRSAVADGVELFTDIDYEGFYLALEPILAQVVTDPGLQALQARIRAARQP